MTNVCTFTGSGLKTECLGSFFKLSVDKSLAFGSRLEFDAISTFPALSRFADGDLAHLDLYHYFSDGTQIEALTPRLADKCGFSIASDPWGNTNVYASLLNCFAGNMVTY